MPEVDFVVYGPGGFLPGGRDGNVVERGRINLPRDVNEDLREQVTVLQARLESALAELDVAKPLPGGPRPRVVLADVLAASNGPDYAFVRGA